MSDRNLDVVMALAAAAWKAGVPADEIIRVVQTVDLEPRVSGEKDAPAAPGKTFAGEDTFFRPEMREALDGVAQSYGAADKPAKPE